MGTDSKIFKPRRFARSARLLSTALVVASGALAGAVPAAQARSVLGGAAPATAATECSLWGTETPFARFGDYATYGLLRSGDLEGRGYEWAMSNAGRVAGNDTLNIRGGYSSLQINPSGSARSSAHCVDDAHPYFRFSARGTTGYLAVSVYDVSTGMEEYVGNMYPTRNPVWQLSPLMKAGLALAAYYNGSKQATFNFYAIGGTWQIDNVYLDPTRRR